MKVAVLGAGSWGTALALQLCRSGDDVHQWDRRPERAREMQAERVNQRYMPGIPLPSNLTVSSDLAGVLHQAPLVVEVVPSQSVRAVMADAAPHIDPGAVVCCASKGIEQSTLMTMNDVLGQVLPDHLHQRLCYLAGPSFAKEVAQGMPTAVVIASTEPAAADRCAEAFHGGAFRAYHTDDIVGAEYGGALKNIIAIACGVSDGMGFGLNARAALITRGLAEIGRLAVHQGANPMTLAGLAGMGDLVLTATGDLSRNRRVGLGLGRGKTLQAVLAELGQVAEGVITTRSAHQLAAKLGIEMPITEQIHALLYEGKPAQAAMRDLMGRQRKHERA